MSYPKVPIGELVSLRQGFAINKNTKHHISDAPTALPLLRIADMKDKVQNVFVKDTIPAHFIAKPEDIIYTRTGQVGLVFTDQYGVIHNNCFTVTPNDAETLNRYYLYYVLQSEDFYSAANNLASGAAQPDLSHGAFRSIEIPIPPLASQMWIAEILKGYDDLIENNQKQIKLLEEAAQRLYKEWFVDLRFPGHETTLIIDGIPQGWEERNIDDVFSVQYGKMLPTSLLVPNGEYPVYGANGVIGYYTKANCFDYVTLITSRGNGSGDVLRTHHKASFVTNNSFVVLPKESYGHFELPFAYHLMKTLDFKSICTGSAQPQLTNKSISMLNVTVPTPAVVKAFCNIANPMFAKIELLYKQIQAAAEARDRLLPKLMNGEIEV
jgi:type I restriction enzyme S subunit